MPSHRPERVAEMVHREVASRLLTDVKDPTLPMVSITHVEMTKDLSRATVRWLPLGGGEVTDAQHDALERAARMLRGPVGRALRLRNAPELVFVYDAQHEEAVRITGLLSELERERVARDGEE